MRIVNPRGTSGSGKTELIRRIMGLYGWSRGMALDGDGAIEPIRRDKRRKLLGYRLRHPCGGRPLAVLGDYEGTSGGGDTIRIADGGIATIVAFTRDHLADGHDVLVEGLRLSSEHDCWVNFARSHAVHVLCLSTPVAQCVHHLRQRRRVGHAAVAAIATHVAHEQALIDRACRNLGCGSRVEVLAFDDAFARARLLLGLAPAGDKGRSAEAR